LSEIGHAHTKIDPSVPVRALLASILLPFWPSQPPRAHIFSDISDSRASEMSEIALPLGTDSIHLPREPPRNRHTT